MTKAAFVDCSRSWVAGRTEGPAVAALSLVFPQRAQVWITEGFCWGRIAFEPSGSFGFGSYCLCTYGL